MLALPGVQAAAQALPPVVEGGLQREPARGPQLPQVSASTRTSHRASLWRVRVVALTSRLPQRGDVRQAPVRLRRLRRRLGPGLPGAVKRP
jgi:hypothetical protein